MRNICIYFLLLVSTSLFGQVNLVPNPSFEDTVSCPTTANQINKAVGWHASRESPDYYNECDWITGTTSIPLNFSGYQYAFQGNAYAGFIPFTNVSPNTREVLTCQLINPLIKGRKYNISFYISLSGGFSKTIACNKIGILFSNVNFDLSNQAPINNYSQFFSDSIVIDTVNWVQIQGNFVADSNYSYLSISNFYDDAHTDTAMIVSPANYSYYYIDEISVMEDTTTSLSKIEVNKLVIFPNPIIDVLNILSPNDLIKYGEIFNSEGQLIMNFINEKNQSVIEVGIHHLSQGVYILKLNYKNKNSSYHKLLKQ